MRALVVVEAFPFLKPLVEFLGTGDDHLFQLPIELFVVDPMGSFRLPVEVGSAGPNVAVLNALIQRVPVELRPKLAAVVGLDAVDLEGQLRQDVIYEGHRDLLRVTLVDP